ncbi:MAG TPA: DUF6786 family protein [Polyangiaceae bacterium]|nr:DUF6786 family protein [Polyangiaceae bacterium]
MPSVTHPTFEDDVAVLSRWSQVTVLASDSGGRVAISPALGGRVMTSAVAPLATGLGWINRPFLEAGKRGTQFDNYGGEDRFWLGPEGGQFGLYFPPGSSFTFASWQTPRALNEGAWDVAQSSDKSVVLTRALHVVNHSGTEFDVAAERTVTILSRSELVSALGVELPPSVQTVAFETKNRITNAGHDAWTKDRGALSVWILGMYAPSPDAHVVVPFETSGQGEIVNDRYFGKVPPERLSVHAREGFLAFTCDGALRSKIGLRPGRARSPIASYSASARLLTLVQYERPSNATDYVSSMWEIQKDPYSGDIVNAYNDGPTEPGKPSLGGFYEMESSSPAALLAPGSSLVHTHRTIHIVGQPADLEPVARRLLGIGLGDFSK